MLETINTKNLSDAIIDRDKTGRRLERSLRPFYVFGIPVPSDVLIYANNRLGDRRVSEILAGAEINGGITQQGNKTYR